MRLSIKLKKQRAKREVLTKSKEVKKLTLWPMRKTPVINSGLKYRESFKVLCLKYILNISLDMYLSEALIRVYFFVRVAVIYFVRSNGLFKWAFIVWSCNVYEFGWDKFTSFMKVFCVCVYFWYWNFCSNWQTEMNIENIFLENLLVKNEFKFWIFLLKI